VYDFIVIGSGFEGSVSAMRFSGFLKLTFNRHASILSHPQDEFFDHPSWRNFSGWKKVMENYAMEKIPEKAGNKRIPLEKQLEEIT